MPKEIVPLTAATHHHDNETAATEISLKKVTETWYDPLTLKKIGYAYLWILTCVLAFIIGVCAGQRASRPHRVRTTSNIV
uniref:Uncharacterized protein n=1 Tax=Panagrolaimus sp. PS1159 TaxID=55785 RepID=A0AC35FTF3_9BILA